MPGRLGCIGIPVEKHIHTFLSWSKVRSVDNQIGASVKGPSTDNGVRGIGE